MQHIILKSKCVGATKSPKAYNKLQTLSFFLRQTNYFHVDSMKYNLANIDLTPMPAPQFG